MKVIFLHPDLGIGGAERLVIDAALALKSNGHSVKFVTCHHNPSHCFTETKNGEISVTVCGDWFPRNFFGRCNAFCAYIRMILAAICVCICESPDIIFCDQISACIPFIRILGRSKILFYCHFPDMLLTGRDSFLKSVYRWPLDRFEEFSTGLAHRILVNSHFTCTVFRKTFKSLHNVQLEVLYPTLHTDFFDSELESFEPSWPQERRYIFLSLNRFENKKNVALALKSLSHLRNIVRDGIWAKVHLVIAGGYDFRLEENHENFIFLEELANRLDVTEHVSFVRSPSDEMKGFLLKECLALLYTPSQEHFGIVPLEAMHCKKPVIAVKSGGPIETVKDGTSGFLVEEGNDFADPMKVFIENPEKAKQFGEQGNEIVRHKFSFASFRIQLNHICNRLITDST